MNMKVSSIVVLANALSLDEERCAARVSIVVDNESPYPLLKPGSLLPSNPHPFAEKSS